MSTTNRAFIKAYRHDTADASPTTSAAPAMLNQSAEVARESTGGVATATATLAGSSATRPKFDAQRSGPKQPLSSFIGRPQSPARPAEVENSNANILEPGTTVASLEWPKICRTLNQACGPQLERVADLLRAQASAGRSLVGIMGLFPRIGATTTALCLAAKAARKVRRAVLVDGNLCHPRIAAWLDAVPTVGWEEVLRHAAPLADAVIRSTDDNLDILALGSKLAQDPELLAGGLQAAVSAGVLRHAYDLVLIDLGPFFDPTSQPVVLELVRNMGIDSLVAVSGPRPADPRDIATINEYLEPSGCELMGTIENRVAPALNKSMI